MCSRGRCTGVTYLQSMSFLAQTFFFFKVWTTMQWTHFSSITPLLLKERHVFLLMCCEGFAAEGTHLQQQTCPVGKVSLFSVTAGERCGAAVRKTGSIFIISIIKVLSFSPSLNGLNAAKQHNLQQTGGGNARWGETGCVLEKTASLFVS